MFKAFLHYPNKEESLNIHNRDDKHNTNFSEIYFAVNFHQLCAAFWHVIHGCHIMICLNQDFLLHLQYLTLEFTSLLFLICIFSTPMSAPNKGK